MPHSKILRIETVVPAVIHWSIDNWSTSSDIKVKDTGLGIYVADLSTQAFAAGKEIEFTFYWPQTDHWEGTDFLVRVGS